MSRSNQDVEYFSTENENSNSSDERNQHYGRLTRQSSSEHDLQNKHVRMLKFRNPGKFMEDFDPERSGREMRKMNRRIYKDTTRKSVYDEVGRLTSDLRDLCDCLDHGCPGCHFPCSKCGSGKCGAECRCNRRWVYQEVEIEGAGQKFVFDSYPQFT